MIGSRALSSGDWKGERGQLGTYTTTPYKALAPPPFGGVMLGPKSFHDDRREKVPETR